MNARGDVEVETLMKVVLALVLVWLALEILDVFVDVLLGVFTPLVGLLVVALIVLWLLDRL